MRAIYIQSHGQPDSVVVGVQDAPEPGPGQVRVRVVAAAFNHVDLYMRESGKGITHELPLILGVDGAGHVETAGAGVERWQAGDRVVLYPSKVCGHCEFCRKGEQMLCLKCKVLGEHVDGAFAEYVVVDEDMLFTLPESIGFEAAAVLPTAYLTAWRMVMTQARVKPTETVLLHGIGGGVALASLQMVELAGGRAIVTSGQDDKLEKARIYGAAATVNYRDDEVVDAVMQFTGGRGVDVVIDNVGEATWGASLRSVRRGGRIVTCGATTGGFPAADLQRVFIRQIKIFGSTLGTHDEFRALIAAVAEGQLEPVIDRVYEFDAAPEALQNLDQAGQFGKLVLSVGSATH